MNQDAWCKVLADHGIPPSHLWRPVGFEATTTVATMYPWHCSPVALLLILGHCSVNMKDPCDRSKCLDQLRGLARVISDGAVLLIHDQERMEGVGEDRVLVRECCHATLNHGRIYFEPESAHDDFPARLRSLHGMPFEACIRHTHSCQDITLRRHLVKALGIELERFFKEMLFTQNPLDCLDVTVDSMRAARNMHIRQALVELPMQESRNAFRASSMLRRVGLKVPLHRAWVDIAYMRRYWFACRFHFNDGLSYSYNSDKSRKGGKDWLVGTVREYECGVIGWVNPMVTMGFLKLTRPKF